MDFVAEVVAEHHAQLKWVLPITHPDEDADIFLLDISFPNGSIASSLTLGSSARSVNVSVLPGVSYKVSLIAKNEDGSGNNSLRFTTPLAGESHDQLLYYTAHILHLISTYMYVWWCDWDTDMLMYQ